jgi:hypothetical protein
MRWRIFAFVSLGVNVLLAVVWMLSAPHGKSGPVSAVPVSASPSGKTNLVVRRQFFSWQEVESPDYPTYVVNLRSIGCPEQTIRDIIVADVNALYTRRRATELVMPDQQWWRTEPDPNVVQVAVEKARGLEEERHALLSRLLGPAWESGDLVNLPRPSRQGVVLDGPLLGTLPTDTKQALEDVSIRSQDRLQTYLEAQKAAGKSADPADLAKLREQTRMELQRLLTPPQLEEFLLRYSQDAINLRSEFGELRYFDPSADEFRAVFRSTDQIDQQLQALTGNDPNTLLQRKALEDQRENAIKIALGADRYAEYRLLQDPLYRDSMATAIQAGSPDAAQTIYEINQATLAEQQRILSDTNLTADQKNIQLKQMQLDQAKAQTVATGQELPPEPPQPPAQQPPRKVTVLGPGESAATIASMYGLPISALQAANPNLNLNRLRPGDSVTIPRSPLQRPGIAAPLQPPPIPFPTGAGP